MFRALATAASGMEAQQTRLDVTANNIANVSTNGFKKSRAEFADLMYQTTRAAGAPTGNGTNAPTGLEVGLGVRVAGTARENSQGEMHMTGNPLDVACIARRIALCPVGIVSDQRRLFDEASCADNVQRGGGYWSAANAPIKLTANVASADWNNSDPQPEIGRASCRERVSSPV